MLRPARPLAAILLALAVAPAEAQAGGWWSTPDVEPRVAAPGERVRAVASLTAADVASTPPAYAYLVRGVDRRMLVAAMQGQSPAPGWWTPPSARLRLAPVRLREHDGTVTATAAFRLRDGVPAGRHAVMLCTAGCRRPLGNVVVPHPGALTVVSDPVLAALARRMDGVEEALRRTRAALRARFAARRARVAAGQARADVDSLRPRPARPPAPEPPGGPPPWLYAAVFGAGALAGGVAVAGLARRGRPVSAVPLPPRGADADLRRLLAGAGRDGRRERG